MCLRVGVISSSRVSTLPTSAVTPRGGGAAHLFPGWRENRLSLQCKARRDKWFSLGRLGRIGSSPIELERYAVLSPIARDTRFFRRSVEVSSRQCRVLSCQRVGISFGSGTVVAETTLSNHHRRDCQYGTICKATNFQIFASLSDRNRIVAASCKLLSMGTQIAPMPQASTYCACRAIGALNKDHAVTSIMNDPVLSLIPKTALG